MGDFWLNRLDRIHAEGSPELSEMTCGMRNLIRYQESSDFEDGQTGVQLNDLAVFLLKLDDLKVDTKSKS